MLDVERDIQRSYSDPESRNDMSKTKVKKKCSFDDNTPIETQAGIVIPETYKDQRNHNLGKHLMNNNENYLRTLIIEKDNAGHLSVRKSELQLAFKLLENQANIMNNALDDIYFKTRQDIYDLQNIISSLSICSDNDKDQIPKQEVIV